MSISEGDFRRAHRGGDVVAEERAVRAVRLLLDGHREFLKPLCLKPALPQHPRELASERAFVPIAREERDRLASLATATYSEVKSRTQIQTG